MGGEEFEDLGFREVKTEGFEGDFEFVVVDSLVFVQVKEAELSSVSVLVIEETGGRAYGFIYFFSLLVGDVV